MLFNSWLASYLAQKPSNRFAVRELLIVDHKTPTTPRLRFEQVIALLRETLDPELRILDIFDQDVPPTYLHYLFAFAIHKGSTVFTTNFDSLIESAYVRLNPHGAHLNIACFDRKQRNFSRCSFQESISTNSKTFLYKLHGSMRLITSVVPTERLPRATITSINSTLDNIGAATQTLRLERYKHLVLIQRTLHKTLVIVGYSGLDDFDVIPSLCEALRQVKRLIWISHNNMTACSVVGPEGIVPGLLLRAARLHQIPVIVVSGDTKLIIKLMFTLPNNLPDPRLLPNSGVPLGLTALPDHDAEKTFFIGRLFEDSGRIQQAEHFYDRAASIFMLNGQPEQGAAALRLAGKMSYLQGNHRGALSLIRRALRLHKSVGNKREIAADLILRSKIFSNTSRYQQALPDSQKAATLYTNVKDKRGVVVALMRESEIRRHLGQYRRSVTLTRRALRISRQRRLRTEMGMCLSILTNLYRRLGRERQALQCAKLAQKLHGMVGNNIGLSNAYRSEASVHLLLGNCAEAEKTSRKALGIAKEVNKIESVATNLDNLGILYRMQGHSKKALRAFRSALKINSDIGKQEEIARGYENIALCYYQQQDLREAEEWVRKAYGVNFKYGIIEGLPRCLATWASIAISRADVAKAHKLLRRAAKLNQKLPNLFEHVRLLGIRGRIASERRNKDAALSALQSSLKLSIKHSYRELTADIAGDLAKVYRALGNEARAKHHFALARKVLLHIGNRVALRRLEQMVNSTITN